MFAFAFARWWRFWTGFSFCIEVGARLLVEFLNSGGAVGLRRRGKIWGSNARSARQVETAFAFFACSED